MADKHPQNAADGKHPAVKPSTQQPAKPITKPAGKDNPKPQEPVTEPKPGAKVVGAGDHPNGNGDAKGIEKGAGKDGKTDDGKDGDGKAGDGKTGDGKTGDGKTGDDKGKGDGSGGGKDKGNGGDPAPPDGTGVDTGGGETNRQIIGLDNFVINVFQWSVPPDGTAETAVKTAKGVIHSKTFKPVKPDSLSLAGLRKYVTSMSAYSAINKWCTEDGGNVDDESLSFPDYLDLIPNQETKTPPKQGSTPSVKVFYKSTASYNTAKVEMPVEFQPDTTPVDPADKTHVDATPLATIARESLIPPDVIQAGSDGNVKGAGDLSETEWAVVLRNCGVFYGWCVDQTNNQIVQAPKAAFRIKSTITNDPIVNVPLLADSDAQNTTPDTTTSTAAGSVPGVPKQHPGIPDFRVNDASTIEVIACEYEFETSMARNDFSSQSTETSMSAGYAGFAVSVSAAVSSTKSSSVKKDVGNYQKTLVAKYLYPRCDLFLYPPDLEPTDELKDAVAKIRKNKNIQDLRRLHSDFGHLFCQNLTIGGRLQSTKIVTESTTNTVQDQKESFKYSIGVSVSTPVGVSTGMKHTEEHGSDQQDATKETSSHDRDIFEACGGDTILANNPVSWAPTVAKYQNWRVINREALIPLADAISGMDGYQDVKACFVQAVPAVSKFIELDDSRQTMTRFRLTSPLNSLSLEKSDDPNPGYYLGHDAGHDVVPGPDGKTPKSGVTPQLLPIDTTIENFWIRIDVKAAPSMFTPETFEAPAILGYKNNMIGDGAFGSSYNDQFRQSEWTITAPFDDALTHGTRIVLQTSPPLDPPKDSDNTKPGPTLTSGGDKPKDSLPALTPQVPPKPIVHMAVFRNQQGVFLPCMSDDDQPQYWRILKKNGGTLGEHIKEGDEVRLAWAFSDQLTGFRDFLDDIFGRRRAQCPDELKTQILYMKLPWPRFETLVPPVGRGDPSPSSMFMVPSDSTNLIYVNMNTAHGMYKYVGQDVSFRIDLISKQPYGDAFDYMLKDVVQVPNTTTTNVTYKHPELQFLFRQWIFHSNLFYF